MKEYWKSDYALNKRSSGIVYQFADGIVEITFEDYIRENPDKTMEDFLALKAISDEIYQQQFSRDRAQTRRELPLYDCAQITAESAEQVMERKVRLRELEAVRMRLEQFIGSGLLTETQERRFRLYCIKGLSTRQIARVEKVAHQSVWESLQYCQKKFQKFLGDKTPDTPRKKR